MNGWGFEQVNQFAKATPWLHGLVSAYAAYGLVLFAGLLLYTTRAGILVLAHRSADFSFPSDHAVMAGAVAAGLWFVSRRLGIIAAIAAVVMAFARVYIAAHYPQDVAAGLASRRGGRHRRLPRRPRRSWPG